MDNIFALLPLILGMKNPDLAAILPSLMGNSNGDLTNLIRSLSSSDGGSINPMALVALSLMSKNTPKKSENFEAIRGIGDENILKAMKILAEYGKKG